MKQMKDGAAEMRTTPEAPIDYPKHWNLPKDATRLGSPAVIWREWRQFERKANEALRTLNTVVRADEP